MFTFASLCSVAVVASLTAPEDLAQTVVADIVVDSGVPEAQRSVFVRDFEQTLGRSARVVRVDGEPSWDRCSQSNPCGSEVTDENVKLAVIGRVEKEGRNFEFVLEARSVQDGKVVASSRDFCELCGVTEAQEMFVGQVGAFVLKLKNLELGPATFRVESVPPGATISVDGKIVGPAPVKLELKDGAHALVATLEGFQAQRRTVNAVSGTAEEVEFQLNSIPEIEAPDSPARDPGRPLRIAGWTSLGVGLASVVTGGVFLGLEARPVETNCSGDNIDADGDCKFRYDSLPHGAALTAVGSALAITGAVLLAVGYKRKSMESQTTARIGPGGIFLEGRF